MLLLMKEKKAIKLVLEESEKGLFLLKITTNSFIKMRLKQVFCSIQDLTNLAKIKIVIKEYLCWKFLLKYSQKSKARNK